MTVEDQGPPTQPLTSILSKVKVTNGQAISLLNSLAEEHYDKDPSLSQALYDTIAGLSGTAETTPAEEDVISRPNPLQPPGSTQPPDHVRSDPNAGPQEVTAREQAKEEPPVPGSARREEVYSGRETREEVQQSPVPGTSPLTPQDTATP